MARERDLEPEDPFDGDDDDEVLVKVLDSVDPPPTKKFKSEDRTEEIKTDVQEQPCCSRSLDNGGKLILMTEGEDDENDPFGEGDDESMCIIADALEDSQVVDQDDGVPLENRFVTRIGRPHPLLIPHVLDNIMSMVEDGKTLLACRAVCKSWQYAAQSKAFEKSTFRNASHLIGRYPYGLSFGEIDERYKPPMQVPTIKRLFIADPCVVLAKQETRDFFETEGGQLEYFGYDASLYCSSHWEFLRNVLSRWCTNLTEIELVGIMCLDSLLTFSELFWARGLKIKKLVVKCAEEDVRSHHHYSTAWKSCRFGHCPESQHLHVINGEDGMIP